MQPTFLSGIRLAWRDTLPERTTVPQRYHDTPFYRDMPDGPAARHPVGMRVGEGRHERCVIDTQRFNNRLAGKFLEVKA